MKNLFLSLSIVAVMLTSCSKSDDSPNPSAGGPMPSKIVTTFSSSTFVVTSNFTYSGNKIVEENTLPAADISKRKYTYTGDNITKVEFFAGPTFTPYGGFNFTYDSGKLKTTTEIAQTGLTGDLRKETLVYNADGTVTWTSSGINQITGAETPNGRQMRYTYTSGFLIKSESISMGIIGQVTDYTNDTSRNQAFKNVLGYNQIELRGNLRLSENYIGNTGANRNYVYTYNTSNYPTQVVDSNVAGTNSNTQVFTY